MGTSSLRRAAQLRAQYPGLKIENLRGNVDTRLRKVADGEVDVAILAAAGLDRLGLSDRIEERLAIDTMLPAPGQGTLAIETRSDDPAVRDLCACLFDADTALTTAAERGLLTRLGADCRTPIGGHARLENGKLRLEAFVADPEGGTFLRQDVTLETPTVETAAAMGHAAADALLKDGAGKWLAPAR